MSNILAWRSDILLALNALEMTTILSLSAGDSEMLGTAQFEKASILHTLGKTGDSLQVYEKTFQMVDSDYPDKRNR
jgi:hypothetical protein